MNKENLLTFIIGFLIVLLAAAIAAGEATGQVLYAQLAAFGSFLLILALFGLGAERGTELMKMVLRYVFGHVGPLKNFQPSGAGSAFLAFIVALAGVTHFDPSLFGEFDAFKSIDPQLVSLLSTALVWIASSVWHKELPDGAGKAQALIA